MSTFSGSVRALSSEGYGVVEHPDGRVFFVKGAWIGDRAEFRIERFEKRYGYARIERLLEPSADRVPPPCPHQGIGPGQCGGCPWMIGTYESQLRAKEQRVRHALARAKLTVDESRVQAIWGSEPYGYRNRAQFKTDGERIGFVSEGSREIAPIDDCLVLNPRMREILLEWRASLPIAAWRPSEGFDWVFVEADDAMSPGKLPVLNRRRPFRQGNSAQNERMLAWVREKVATLPVETPVVELFCGSGNFTQVLSERGFASILALEVADAAMAQLQARELPNVRTKVADLSRLPALLNIAKLAPKTRLLVLDPPRAGAKGVERLVAALPELERILYVSCDVATFTRDASALKSAGFELAEVQPLDLFPHTSHVEVLTEFRRSPA